MKRLLLSLLILSSSYAKEVCITNFGKPLCKNFTILDSVIIKSKLSKVALVKKLNRDIKQIAFLKNSNLYLVDSNNSLEYSKELTKDKDIIYAQANILQVKNQNQTLNKAKNVSKKYNLDKIWKITKGQGVNIAIIDDGFDLSHEDLKDTKLIFSYDVDNKLLNSNPKVKLDTHGTKVAGIIFAQHNTVGIRGIAPDANLIAIRQTTNITADTVLAYTVASKAGAHIINCSWNSPILLEPVYDVIKDLSKDIAIVISAGNSAKEIKPLSIEASIKEVITVGATQKYSNYGDMVDFIIPSGILTTSANNSYKPFGGTSATAPIISGLLALKMSQKKYKGMSVEEVVGVLKSKIK